MASPDHSAPLTPHRQSGPFAGPPARLFALSVVIAFVAAIAAGGLALRGSATTVAASTPAGLPAAGAAVAAPSPPPSGPARVQQSGARTISGAPAATSPAAAPATTPAPARSVAPGAPLPSSMAAASPQPTAAPSPAPPALAPSATPARDASSSALSPAAYQPILEAEHQVQPGETLSAIAQKWGVTTETLVMNNAGVTDRDMLKIGQKLRVPPRDGLLYEVRLGESILVIASRYGVDAGAIVSEPANRLSSPDMVREGQVVLVPGARLPQPAPLVALTASPSPSGTTTPAAPVATATPTRNQPAATAAAVPNYAWRWPITGPLSSYFGPSHPLGIDIDLYGRDGEPIRAARGGTVTYAGGNPCCSYGYYVEVDHGDGMRTLYAHFNSPPPVRIGQTVSQGQVVGYAGTTGYSTGTHLHFEIRRSGAPLNPLSFLP